MSKASIKKMESRKVRTFRVRANLTVSPERPRLAVFRSGRHMYAQIIDDFNQKTLVSASTVTKDLKGAVKKPGSMEAAKKVGEAVAKKALEMKILTVCFDRRGYLYHGRVKALAEGARAAGLKF